MASDPAARTSSRAGRCRRAGWATATGQPSAVGCPPTAIWPPKSTIHGWPSAGAATNRRSASPLPNAPASRVASAVRATRHVSESNRKCARPVAVRAAPKTSGTGTAPLARSPHASTRRPTAGSNAPPVSRCQRASRGQRPHRAGGSPNGSPIGCRLSPPRTLSARHVLSDASVCSISTTIRSSACSPAVRSAVSATKVAQVPIRWTVRSTRGATAGVCRVPAAPPAFRDPAGRCPARNAEAPPGTDAAVPETPLAERRPVCPR